MPFPGFELDAADLDGLPGVSPDGLAEVFLAPAEAVFEVAAGLAADLLEDDREGIRIQVPARRDLGLSMLLESCSAATDTLKRRAIS